MSEETCTKPEDELVETGESKLTKNSRSKARERRSYAYKLYFKEWSMGDIKQELMDQYGISPRAADRDIRFIKDLMKEQCLRDETEYLHRKRRTLLERMEHYESLANIGEDERANAQLLKQRDALEKDLDEFTIPNYLKRIKAKETEAVTPEVYQSLMVEYLKSFHGDDNESEPT